MACARVRVPGVCAIGSLPVVVALALLVRPFSSPPSEFSPAFFCRVPADSGCIPSQAALPLLWLPSAAYPCCLGQPPYTYTSVASTSTSWCMGSSSVDALLTCPRPLLCCCSCSRPFWTAPVQVGGLGLPSFYTPSISLCVRVLCHACAGGR